MTIFIVEIPHTSPPIAWTASDEASFIFMVEKSLERSGGIEQTIGHESEAISFDEDGDPEEWAIFNPTFDDACEANGGDLSCQYIFMSEKEARDAIEEIKGHQCFKAQDVLREELKILE